MSVNNIVSSDMLTGYMKLIEANLDNRSLARKLSTQSFPFEFWAGVNFTAELPTRVVVSVIKLPFSFFSMILSDKSVLGVICKNVHQKIPGLSAVFKTAAKAIFCYFNIIFSPLLGLINPEANLRLHIATGIVQEFAIHDVREKGKKPLTTKTLGFAALAGMKDIKAQLQKSIINPLKNPEKFKKYKLNVPNGVLLYGPPGCGKTYLVEHLAAEIGWNYMELSASTYGSKWIHEASQKLSEAFDKASVTPTVIFIDEVETLIPKRSELNTENGAAYAKKEEVGTFLIELQTAADRNILVCLATNRPEDVDEAALRTGRIDLKIEVGLPDKLSRAELFQFHMKGRPADENIDYTKFIELTEDFCASDIKAVVVRAATEACNKDIPISETLLQDSIKTQKQEDDHMYNYNAQPKKRSTRPLSYFS